MMLVTLREARNLAQRFEQGELFRLYVRRRLWLIGPLCAVMLATSVACAAATIVLFTEIAPWLALVGILLAPLVLFGSLLLQAYVLFSWLEDRALHRAGAHLARAPDVPWALAAAVVFLPLAILLFIAPAAGLVLLGLQVGGPLLYARYDR
jgi:hypothetical protein